MAEKFKKRLSRRAQERQKRDQRTFDLTMLALLIVTIVCGALCYFRGADLKPGASSGFAYWFLVVVGYLPMTLINLFRTIFGMQIPSARENVELFLHGGSALFVVTAYWLVFRIAGRRSNKTQLLHICTRLAQIFICWGVFQLCCMGITVGLNRGGRASVQSPTTCRSVQKQPPTGGGNCRPR